MILIACILYGFYSFINLLLLQIIHSSSILETLPSLFRLLFFVASFITWYFLLLICWLMKFIAYHQLYSEAFPDISFVLQIIYSCVRVHTQANCFWLKFFETAQNFHCSKLLFAWLPFSWEPYRCMLHVVDYMSS